MSNKIVQIVCKEVKKKNKGHCRVPIWIMEPKLINKNKNKVCKFFEDVFKLFMLPT